MTTTKTPSPAGFNFLKPVATRYALQFVSGPHAGRYLSAFQADGWKFDTTELWAIGHTFNSQTQALCVAFCLMIDNVTRVIAVKESDPAYIDSINARQATFGDELCCERRHGWIDRHGRYVERPDIDF